MKVIIKSFIISILLILLFSAVCYADNPLVTNVPDSRSKSTYI